MIDSSVPMQFHQSYGLVSFESHLLHFPCLNHNDPSTSVRKTSEGQNLRILDEIKFGSWETDPGVRTWGKREQVQYAPETG